MLWGWSRSSLASSLGAGASPGPTPGNTHFFAFLQTKFVIRLNFTILIPVKNVYKINKVHKEELPNLDLLNLVAGDLGTN